MNRNMKLVRKRQSLIGIFITRKRAKGYTIKKAVEEAAVIFSVGIKTEHKTLVMKIIDRHNTI